MINALDVLVIATFLGIIGIGFINGVSRLASALLSIYFGTIFACAFYRPVSDFAHEKIPTMGRQTGELFFFAALLVVSATVLGIVIQRWLGDVKLPRRLEIID